MPLVVPGVTANNLSATDVQQWMTKLMGKTVTDSATNETNFCKKDLPQKSRIIQPGTMTTTDFVADRLNIHVNEEGTVVDIKHG